MSYENNPKGQHDHDHDHAHEQERGHHHDDYGFMEREVAFKLLASHAMVDGEFFDQLRKDPEAAAAVLHIRLNEKDLDYLRNIVEWDEIDKYSGDIRRRLHLEMVTNSW